MFRLEIETENEAFQDENKAPEVARILEELAKRIATISDTHREAGPVFDVNGKHVGAYGFTHI